MENSEVTCGNCINHSFPSSPRHCLISMGSIKDSTTTLCEGRDFRKKHEDRVYCTDCEHHKITQYHGHTAGLTKDELDLIYLETNRCNVVKCMITKTPISCKDARAEPLTCGYNGRAYKPKTVKLPK